MAPRTQRAMALALAGALVALGPVARAAPAPRAEAGALAGGPCTSATGITVVVDLTAFGDGVQVGCAPQPVRSGFEALSRAGFTFEGTTQFPGLLCRIDGEPSNQACHGAPPANAYWAYWHAPPGGSWTYSSSGAGSRVPPPGSVEGWAFGDDAEPGVDPPGPLPTRTTRPPTTTTRPSSGGTDGGTSPGTGGTTDSATGTTGGAGLEPTTSTVEGGADGSTTTTRPAAAAGAEDDEDGSAEAASASPTGDGEGSGGGSPAGAIVGILVVAALVIAAIRVARRRPSEEELA